MLVVLAGKSGSGKSTVATYIEENFDIEKIKTVTTRPQRLDNPNDPKDYIFKSTKEFLMSIPTLTLIKHYETVHGQWWYGVRKKDIRGIKKNNKLILLDPKGVEELKEFTNEENIVIIECACPDNIRVARTLERNDNEKEVMRRLEADRLDFAGFNPNVTLYNCTESLDELYKAVDYAMLDLNIPRKDVGNIE